MYFKVKNIEEVFLLTKRLKEEVKEFLIKSVEEEAYEKKVSKFEILQEKEKEIWGDHRKNHKFVLRLHYHKKKLYVEALCNGNLNCVFYPITQYCEGIIFYKDSLLKNRDLITSGEVYDFLRDNHDYAEIDILTPDNFYYMSPSNKWFIDSFKGDNK